VWVDDLNPEILAGLARCLEEGGFEVVGTSSGLIPEPPEGVADVLVFDIGEPVVAWDVIEGTGTATSRLIGVAVAGPGQRLGRATLDSVLIRADATPEALLHAVDVAAGALRLS
jgi:hypothetical protein